MGVGWEKNGAKFRKKVMNYREKYRAEYEGEDAYLTYLMSN